jgi:CRP-like cAMP-binding protein
MANFNQGEEILPMKLVIPKLERTTTLQKIKTREFIRQFISARPEHRPKADQLRMCRFFQDESFFQKLDIDLYLNKIVNNLSLVTYAAGHILYKQGSPSEYFYIVLTGSVNI